MKSRFRLTGGAEPKVMYSRPGHVHKRCVSGLSVVKGVEHNIGS